VDGRCSTARIAIAKKKWSTQKCQLLDACQAVDKKDYNCSNQVNPRINLFFLNILSSLTIRPKMNDWSNHNCSNQSKLLGVRLGQIRSGYVRSDKVRLCYVRLG
jgi:hypothetical protein